MTGARARNSLEERYNMVHVAQEELIVRIWLPHAPYCSAQQVMAHEKSQQALYHQQLTTGRSKPVLMSAL